MALNRRDLLLAMAALSACGDDPGGPPPYACTPSPASPTSPHALAHDPGSASIVLAGDIARRFMADNPAEEMGWDWGESVAMYAISELFRVTAEADLSGYLGAWLDHHIAVGYEALIVTSDRCPPALSAVVLHRQACEERYRQLVLAVLDYLDNDALRTEDGGINHLGTLNAFGVSLWLDSLFMFGNVWTRWAEHTGDGSLLDALHQQYTIFASHLAHPSGWLKHAHNWSLATQDDDVFWARGNGWVSAAGYEYLRVRQQRGETDPEVQALLQGQVDAILAAQDGSGLWWTVVNRPGETYLETSASALFVTGMARGYRLGLLDDSVLPAIEAGLDGIATRIISDPAGPIVSGISGPTSVGDFDYYAGIEQGDNTHYGVGAVLLALIETSGL